MSSTSTTTTTTTHQSAHAISPFLSSSATTPATTTSFATLSDVSIEPSESGTELKWCAFAKGTRGSIAKIIVDVVQPTVAHVRVVFVRKEYRGHGLGTLLMRQAQNSLACNGFQTLLLEAEENTTLYGKLVGLYERCGFTVIPGVKETLEYNDDECFRKVAMRCDLATTIRPAPKILDLVDSFDFNQSLRREALEICHSRPLGLTILECLDVIEARVFAGSLAAALEALRLARQRGHPDWMELAAGLRFLGKIQHVFNDWHVPYTVLVERQVVAAARGRGESGQSGHSRRRRRRQQQQPQDGWGEEDEDDGERVGDAAEVKSGPLPDWVCLPESAVVDPERFPSKVGLDELVLTWSDNEFAWTCLQGAHGSAPHELLQILRYANLTDWLVAREGREEEGTLSSQTAPSVHDLASEEDNAVLRDLVLIHRSICAEADGGAARALCSNTERSPDLSPQEEEQQQQQQRLLRFRLEFLVEKYFGKDTCVI